MKTYMKPNINIVNIEIQQILAGSPLDTSTATPQQTDFGGETDKTGGNLSRGGRGFWDDEEDF